MIMITLTKKDIDKANINEKDIDNDNDNREGYCIQSVIVGITV